MSFFQNATEGSRARWNYADTVYTPYDRPSNLYKNLGFRKGLEKCANDESLILTIDSNGHMEADDIMKCKYLGLEAQ